MRSSPPGWSPTSSGHAARCSKCWSFPSFNSPIWDNRRIGFDPTQIFGYRRVLKGRLTTVLNRERAERRHSRGVSVTMKMLRKIGRLFVIKTRLEAYLVTYAIAVGAIERGIHYMQSYPGNAGLLLASACLGVPFVAGAKLLDSVRPAARSVDASNDQRRVPARRVSRNRPRDRRSVPGLALRSSHRTD